MPNEHGNQVEQVFHKSKVSLYRKTMSNEDHLGIDPVPAERSRLIDLFGELPSQTLLQVVQYCSPQCAGAVTFMLTLAAAATRLQRELADELEAFQLDGRDFTTLLILYTLDPSPVTTSDLACHAGVTQRDMSVVLQKLEASDLLLWKRNPATVSLTRTGLCIASRALNRFIDRLTSISHRLPRLDPTVAAEIGSCLQVIAGETSDRTEPALRV